MKAMSSFAAAQWSGAWLIVFVCSSHDKKSSKAVVKIVVGLSLGRKRSGHVSTLASGGDDKTIKLWDTQTGKVSSTLTGHRYRQKF